MTQRRSLRLNVGPTVGVAAAAVTFLLAGMLEGGSLRSLWQPTAALVVFGGTAVAIVISYPYSVLRRTTVALRQAFAQRSEPIEPVLEQICDYARKSRRRGLLSLEHDVDRATSPFMRVALGLAVDGTSPVTSRQILEIENQALRESEEAPAEVLETAAGYAPTLGILGAVLGLIHVMESLSDPSKLGSGIAVAFVATVYGVAVANLLLLPLATRLRGLARDAALSREIVIEGVVGLQDGLSLPLIEQKLRGYLPAASPQRRRFSA